MFSSVKLHWCAIDFISETNHALIALWDNRLIKYSFLFNRGYVVLISAQPWPESEEFSLTRRPSFSKFYTHLTGSEWMRSVIGYWSDRRITEKHVVCLEGCAVMIIGNLRTTTTPWSTTTGSEIHRTAQARLVNFVVVVSSTTPNKVESRRPAIHKLRQV